MERTDSYWLYTLNGGKTYTIENIENDTFLTENCTNQLIVGFRNTFQKGRRGPAKSSLKNYAEFLWLKEILHVLCSFSVAVAVLDPMIQSSKVAILEFIHDQDGEK